MTRLTTLLIGSSGFTASVITPELVPQSADTAGITQTIIQLIIGIVTLFGLLRKKKPVH